MVGKTIKEIIKGVDRDYYDKLIVFIMTDNTKYLLESGQIKKIVKIPIRFKPKQ